LSHQERRKKNWLARGKGYASKKVLEYRGGKKGRRKKLPKKGRKGASSKGPFNPARWPKRKKRKKKKEAIEERPRLPSA